MSFFVAAEDLHPSAFERLVANWSPQPTLASRCTWVGTGTTAPPRRAGPEASNSSDPAPSRACSDDPSEEVTRALRAAAKMQGRGDTGDSLTTEVLAAVRRGWLGDEDPDSDTTIIIPAAGTYEVCEAPPTSDVSDFCPTIEILSPVRKTPSPSAIACAEPTRSSPQVLPDLGIAPTRPADPWIRARATAAVVDAAIGAALLIGLGMFAAWLLDS